MNNHALLSFNVNFLKFKMNFLSVLTDVMSDNILWQWIILNVLSYRNEILLLQQKMNNDRHTLCSDG